MIVTFCFAEGMSPGGAIRSLIYLIHLFFLCSSCYLFINLVLSFEICFLYPCGPLKYVSSFIQQLFLCTDYMPVTMLGIENMKIKYIVLQSGEGNGNPLQYSCLENPRDRGAWWAAVYGVAQSRTRLKRLSSRSSCSPQGSQCLLEA